MYTMPYSVTEPTYCENTTGLGAVSLSNAGSMLKEPRSGRTVSNTPATSWQTPVRVSSSDAQSRAASS